MNDKLLLQSFNYTVCSMWLMLPDGIMWGGGYWKNLRVPDVPWTITLVCRRGTTSVCIKFLVKTNVESSLRVTSPLLPCGPGVNDVSILGVSVGNYISISTLKPESVNLSVGLSQAGEAMLGAGSIWFWLVLLIRWPLWNQEDLSSDPQLMWQ